MFRDDSQEKKRMFWEKRGGKKGGGQLCPVNIDERWDRQKKERGDGNPLCPGSPPPPQEKERISCEEIEFSL